MGKEQFLGCLGRNLRKLKREERRRQLEYYDEMITDMTESGMGEEEAVRKMGKPEDVAKNILEQAPKENLRKADVPGAMLCLASLLCVMVVFVFQRARGFSFYMGGGDGPTSVFVAGKLGRPMALYVVTIVLITVTVIYYVRKIKGR